MILEPADGQGSEEFSDLGVDAALGQSEISSPLPSVAGEQEADAIPVRGLPLYLNFCWTAGGNITYAISQWGMIVALAKLTNAFTVGQFVLGIAISTPVLRLAHLQL